MKIYSTPLFSTRNFIVSLSCGGTRVQTHVGLENVKRQRRRRWILPPPFSPFSFHARNPVAGNGNTRRMIDRCERDIFFNLVSLVQFNRSLRRKLFQREESLSIRAKRKFEKYISLRSPTLSRYGIRIIYNAREFRVDFSVPFFFSFLFDTKLFF